MYFKKFPSSLGVYKCYKPVANYLIKNEIPLLSQDGGIFIFAKSPKFEQVLAEMPWYLKIYKKVR
jgi:hypothetical protein